MLVLYLPNSVLSLLTPSPPPSSLPLPFPPPSLPPLPPFPLAPVNSPSLVLSRTALNCRRLSSMTPRRRPPDAVPVVSLPAPAGGLAPSPRRPFRGPFGSLWQSRRLIPTRKWCPRPPASAAASSPGSASPVSRELLSSLLPPRRFSSFLQNNQLLAILPNSVSRT